MWIYYIINTVNRLHVLVTFWGHLYGNVYEGYASKTSRPMYQFTIWHHLSVAGRICWDLLFRNSVSAGIITQNSLYSLSKLTEAFNFKPAIAPMKSEYVSSFCRQLPVYRQWCSVPSVWQLTGLGLGFMKIEFVWVMVVHFTEFGMWDFKCIFWLVPQKSGWVVTVYIYIYICI